MVHVFSYRLSACGLLCFLFIYILFLRESKSECKSKSKSERQRERGGTYCFTSQGSRSQGPNNVSQMKDRDPVSLKTSPAVSQVHVSRGCYWKRNWDSNPGKPNMCIKSGDLTTVPWLTQFSVLLMNLCFFFFHIRYHRISEEVFSFLLHFGKFCERLMLIIGLWQRAQVKMCGYGIFLQEAFFVCLFNLV